MDFIIDAIVEWLKGLLVDGIMGNLDGLFNNVNQSVGEIATQVGTTPADWNAGVFSMIRQISETAILPIAGVILTFVMTYELIDKQKTSENVYFLNTVTTDDLLPLAEQGKEPPKEVTPEPEPKPTEPVEEVPEPEPEKKDSPLLSLLLIGAVVLAGGGIGYYFKIYKPKHEAPDLEDDYCEYEDGELEEIAEEPEDEDTPPWEEDTEE